MKQVLFVCLGNICRSPLAEAIFDHKTQDLDLESDSAGTAAYHVGEKPDDRTINVALKNGVPIDSRARKFMVEDYDNFDYIIAMDKNNYEDIRRIGGGDHPGLHLMREFDSLNNGDLNVPDPYYGGQDGFDHIFQMLSRSIVELIEKIESDQR